MIYPKKKFDKVKFGKIDETNVSKNKSRRKPVLVNEEIVEEEKQNVYNNQQKESEQNRKMNELLQKMAKLELENQKLKEKEES